MKWLLVLAIVLALAAYVVFRYRKHLQTGWFMYRTFRQMKKKAAAPPRQVPQRDTSKDSELVSCPKCGKWASKDESVKLKGDFFCSLGCLEEMMAERTK